MPQYKNLALPQAFHVYSYKRLYSNRNFLEGSKPCRQIENERKKKKKRKNIFFHFLLITFPVLPFFCHKSCKRLGKYKSHSIISLICLLAPGRGDNIEIVKRHKKSSIMLIIFCQYLFEGIFVLVCVRFLKRFYSYLFAQKVLKGTFGFS